MQLVLDDVGHRFSDNPWLFRHLSRQLVPGEVYGLIGPSGSGKSTLLSLMAGWEKPAEGTIECESIEKISWVFQNPFGMRNRSAIDHVMLPSLALGMDIDEAEQEACRLLDVFSLSAIADQPFSSLSGGEAQRLMLARGAATRPDLLLVDEPTAQLDLHTRASVNDAIAALAGNNVIVIVATHDEETKKSCTHVIDLREAQEGTGE